MRTRPWVEVAGGIFPTCRRRAEVLAGTIRDEEFMADLSRAVNCTATGMLMDG